MATYPATGIVIGRTDFGEADRIVRLFTLEKGRISTVARGVRKIKSRMAGHLEPLGEVKLTLAEGRNLDVVATAQLISYPHRLSQDYHLLETAFMMTSILDRLVEEHQPHPDLYAVLSEAIAALDGGVTGPLLELWYKLRVLEALGYHPVLDSCSTCGTNSSDASYWFNAARGGIMDESCRLEDSTPMDTATIKLWRLLLVQPFAAIAGTMQGSTYAAASLPQCDAFYSYHLGRAFTPGISSH